MFKNMKLRQKLMLGAAFLAIVPIVIASFVLGRTAIGDAQSAMEERAKNQLVSLRDIKSAQISDYFNNMNDQVITFSNDRMIIDFARDLMQAFRSYPFESKGGADTGNLRSSLGSYYRQEFGPEYSKQNNGAASPANRWLDQLDKEGVALQHRFIKANPNPLGSKNQLADSGDGTTYGVLHATFHPHINDFLTRFGYYDIFIADPETGDIVYSVFKELDYATSLKSGPFASTGIGEVFRKANSASSADFVAVTDFAPYGPSYMGAASFIASPIYDGGKKLGILIFQMPIDRINAVMTNKNRWLEAGLGESGETYLVGQDRLMRSQSRFLIEDKDGFLSALDSAGTSRVTLDAIKSKDSAIGLAEVSSASAINALAGQTGYHIIPDYRGVPVLSAYGPVDILGMRWALLAEIDEEEAFRANVALEESIVTSAVFISGLVAVLACLAGMVFANSISSPIIAGVNLAEKISRGDLTGEIEVEGNDEIGQLQRALRTMKDNLFNIVGSVRDSTHAVSSAAEQIARGNFDLSQRTEEQASSLEETASSMEEMVSTVTQNADNAVEANKIVIQTRDQAVEGGDVVQRAIVAMSEINASSTRIAEIVGVIDDIAFQTNLLALNAAVEAARAGDQGRGFAVVASEVRTLAQRSAESAKEIKSLITDSVNKVNQGSELVNQSGVSLGEIVEGVKNVAGIVAEIAAASEEQSNGAAMVNKAVTQMDEVTQQNAALVEEASAASQAMNEQTLNLSQQMEFFNLGDRQVRSGHSSDRPSRSSVTTHTPNRTAAAKPLRVPMKRAAAPVSSTAEAEDWQEF